jgi:DNA helicase II / ATP-dependent DNA helicase PcrA
MERSLARVLGGLTLSQREAVTTEAAPLCVIAGAGSGKTRVLTRRVARRVLDGSADAKRTLVLTFTRKAADELRRRLATLEAPDTVEAGTFHAVAYAQLRRHWADHRMRPPAILGYPERMIRRLLTELTGEASDETTVSAISAEISWARARSLEPEQYPQEARTHRRGGPDPELVSRMLADYALTKRRRGVVDLDDLVTFCAELLERDDEFAQAQRWLFRHFFVDELQDLNPAQWRLLRGWLGERTDLFVVGDPLQAVYTWNGADPDILSTIEQQLPGTTVVHLDDNHRCTQPVIDVARAALGPLGTPARIRSAREDPGSNIEIGEFEDDETEAVALSRWLRNRRRPGAPWSSVGVLARTNARLDPVADVLSRAGIPVIRHGRRDGSPEQRVLETLGALRRDMPIRSAFAHLAADYEGDLEWLARQVDELCSEEPGSDLGQFLSWRRANGASERPVAGRDGVQLATFHRAKGLEWTAVAVIGLEQGLMPIAHAATPSALCEERRLLYVALTRAEHQVWCSSARHRTADDRSWTCEPSPFLSAIRLAASQEPHHDPIPPSVRVSQLRSRLAVAG